jgi:protoheme IX farnesyltransferase
MSTIDTDGTVVDVNAERGALHPTTRVRRKSRVGNYVELTKPRLTLLSVLTTLAGFYVGTSGSVDAMLLLHTLAGTFLVGGGCGALNMYVEREHDGLMKRTMNRPLPAGRILPIEALLVGLLLTLGGTAYLMLAVNVTTGAIALVTAITYVLFYTPLKRLTPLNTLVGAIPGALPPVIGWTAAGNGLGVEAMVLFAILFFWQMPHFLSLAWMYRKDYQRAGYRMLTVFDPDGASTSRQILIYTATLVPITLLPTLFGIAGYVYFFGALLLGIGFVAYAMVLLMGARRTAHARGVFYYSLLYLPALLLAMVLDRGGM